MSSRDTYEVIPILQEVFDEPYGNASAVSAYFCSRMASQNSVETLYAGDGGDELFAGNQRYADQGIFEYYEQIPAWIREKIIEPIVLFAAEKLNWGVFKNGKKYIARAKLPYYRRIISYEFLHVVPYY